MRNSRHKSGFTLIELLAALVAASVLILAMGSTLIWLIRGETQSTNSNESFNRVDLIRDILHTNLRAGRAIRFPTTDALVTNPADGVGVAGRGTISAPFNGEEVWIELQNWNTTTSSFEIVQTMWRWNSTTQVLAQQQELSAIGGARPTAAVNWSQGLIQNFDVIRVSSRRLRFVVDTIEVDQPAQSQFTVTLRNIP
jgi:prepilin-type N-terminal cleavage/methylation domain-containing protein